ncbi:hypothetical protein [Nostoc sp. CHAB 5715]|uniref:hypothetical protein n=1 Tax=Nostoc sp. CHAB 5715 TaxID=2780400 RepID=UPI001E3D1E2A|nr:hypothetical protein [Nostoc sp. CHAB 5715]MCC5622653.1 hypothetical protein [Nostoc sp. CHAB 5715]
MGSREWGAGGAGSRGSRGRRTIGYCPMPHTSAYFDYAQYKSLSTSAPCPIPNPPILRFYVFSYNFVK